MTNDHTRNTIVPFINKTDGVYCNNEYYWKSTKKKKLINPKEHEIISWELNGKTYNFDYDK